MPNKWFEEKIGRKEQKHILFPAQWRQPQFETDPFELGKAFLVHHFISNRGVGSKAQLQRETTKNIWVSSLNKVLASQAKNCFRFAVTIEKVSLRAAWALVSPPKTVFYFRIQQLLSSAKYFFAYFRNLKSYLLTSVTADWNWKSLNAKNVLGWKLRKGDSQLILFDQHQYYVESLCIYYKI